MALGALHHGLRAGVAVLFDEPGLQTAGVDADADGDAPFPAGLRHRLHVLRAADVAGVDADLVNAPLRHRQGQPVVKMNIRHQGDADLLLDFGDGLGGAHIRDGQADNVRPRHLHGLDLGHRGLHVPGLGVAHGLDGDRGAAADLHPAHVYFFHGISFIHHFVTILKISLNITNAISASSSIMPAAWI